MNSQLVINSAGPGPVAIIALLVLASAILVAIGLVLRRRGMLTSRRAALGWAVVAILPVFVGSAILILQR
jgi:ABC-type uncharacterized transport system permease subunit